MPMAELVGDMGCSVPTALFASREAIAELCCEVMKSLKCWVDVAGDAVPRSLGAVFRLPKTHEKKSLERKQYKQYQHQ